MELREVLRCGFEFENTYFTEICSGSEAGSYSRLTDSVYHSTLGLRVIKKTRSFEFAGQGFRCRANVEHIRQSRKLSRSEKCCVAV